MNLEQASQLIGKYVELVIQIDSNPYTTYPNMKDITIGGFVTEIVLLGSGIEALRFRCGDHGDTNLKTIKKWRVYEHGEWQE